MPTPDRDKQVRDLLERVHTLLCQLKYDEALPLARQAVALAPRSLEAWRELGSACAHVRQVEEMEAAFEQAQRLAVMPDEEYITWYVRGNAENNCNAWEAAVRSFERMAELEPDEGLAWLMCGMVLSNMGTFIDSHYYEEALVALDRALTLTGLRDVDRRVAYGLRYKSLVGLGRTEEAAEARRIVERLLRTERPGIAKWVTTTRRPQIH
jgi:tetratricopeptide (TPR) repeat protein